MKVPKSFKRYCKYCKKHTEMTIKLVHKGKRGTLKDGQRRRKRIKTGHGDGGHYSKPAIKDWARNSKVTQVKNANLECNECHKKQAIKGGFKAKKFEIIK